MEEFALSFHHGGPELKSSGSVAGAFTLNSLASPGWYIEGLTVPPAWLVQRGVQQHHKTQGILLSSW